MHSRRDILKLFGAGAAIVPIIGGTPEFSAEAQLTAPAEIILPERSQIIPGSVLAFPSLVDQLGGPVHITVIMREADTPNIKGREYVFSAKSFVVRTNYAPLYVGSPPQVIPSSMRAHWVLEGDCLADDDQKLFEVSRR